MEKKKGFWEHPWRYKQSFLIAISLVIIGFLLEVFSTGYAIKIPSWPYNLLVLVVIVAAILLMHFFIKNRFIKWFSSVPASISAITIVTFMIMLMGFIPQVRKPGFLDLIGLTDVVKSWPYLLCTVYLLLVLGFTIVRNMKALNIKNSAFFLNHAGLWIIIAAASLGSADMEKYRMNLVLDRAIFTAEDYNGGTRQMPFALKLTAFNIDEYPPTLGILNPRTSQLYLKKGDKLPEVTTKEAFQLGDWEIEIKQYLTSAHYNDSTSTYFTSEEPGSAAVVFVSAKNVLNNEIHEGWITSGNFMINPEFLPLDSLHSIGMTIPRPQRFSSDIRVFKKVGEYYDINLEVNKPKDIYGWKTYQTGYSEEYGKWSKLSVVELVKDPWLPVVYIGIFMVMLGGLYLLWMGKSKN